MPKIWPALKRFFSKVTEILVPFITLAFQLKMDKFALLGKKIKPFLYFLSISKIQLNIFEQKQFWTNPRQLFEHSKNYHKKYYFERKWPLHHNVKSE